MRPIITAIKHYINHPITTVAAGAVARATLVRGISVSAVGANAFEVQEGAVVKAIYVEYWVSSDDATLSSGTISFEKVPSEATNMTSAQSQNLGAYPNKKNLLETHQGLFPSQTQNPVNIFRHWVKIPKGKQRIGLGDEIVINFMPIADGLKFCGLATYKEYS